MWDNFSASSPDLRLSLVTWVVDERRGPQQSGLKEVIQRVLQVRHELLPRFLLEENNRLKKQSNSFQFNNLLTVQREDIGKA